MRSNLISIKISILALMFLSACDGSASDFFEIKTEKSYEDVLQDVEFIIAEQNFRITSRMHIGDAIQERGRENFPRYDIFLFCNLTLAEKMLSLEPSYINYCPYKIATAESPTHVTVSTRLLPEKTGNKNLDAVAEKINKILRIMIEYGASDEPFLHEINNDSLEIP